MKKKIPTKSSTFQPTIQIGNFNSELLRKKFLNACMKELKITLTVEQITSGEKDWVGFKAALKILCDKMPVTDKWADEDDDKFSGYPSFESCATCCGVDELTELPSSRKAILLVILKSFIRPNYYEDQMGPYLKYYHNLTEGQERFKVLKDLGWRCTGIFKNINHGWHNYEYSAYYGDK